MNDLRTKHIEMVEAVNTAKTEREHREADLRLEGFRKAIECVCPGCLGMFLIAADLHYINQGIDRPMCCGVWMDWKPTP